MITIQRVLKHMLPCQRNHCRPGLLALLLGLVAVGCTSSGQRADPVDASRARESLRTALETWKKGEKPDALSKGSPGITVQDMDWENGCRLVAYEVIGDGKT